MISPGRVCSAEVSHDFRLPYRSPWNTLGLSSLINRLLEFAEVFAPQILASFFVPIVTIVEAGDSVELVGAAKSSQVTRPCHNGGLAGDFSREIGCFFCDGERLPGR
ncbi:MAG: hypothetical protein RL215_2189 [Planctomycetota bacterium]|jgi:hypothetical protein